MSTHLSEEYPQRYPKVVQIAIQQADILSKNLKNLRSGHALQKFRYKNNGSMGTIGRNLAVTNPPKFHLSGII
ncbi:MAG: hypothetical protein QQN41_13250 [Nitrosopumilus sp.]